MRRTDRSDADERSRDARGPDAVETVPTIGFVVAAIATVGPLLSLRRGVTEPAVAAATACAGLATLAFLARRRGVLPRRVGAPIAAVASALAVVLAGYAIAIGATESVAVPDAGWSVSIVLGSLFAAGAAVGVGVADYAGVSGTGLARRGVRFVEMLVVGFIGLVAIDVAGVLLFVLSIPLVGEPTQFQLTALSYLGFGVGLGTVAIGYLNLRGYGLSYLDIEVPSVRSVLWMIGGVVAVVGANVAMTAALTAAGIEWAGHGTVENVRENLDLLVIVVPAMLLIVGPAEELLYRNVIQKTLYETFSRYGAVVVTSVVFAAVHVSAYATAGAGQVLTSLGIVFGLSLVLGTIYERTDNLVVPAIVHGGYNAILFATLLL